MYLLTTQSDSVNSNFQNGYHFNFFCIGFYHVFSFPIFVSDMQLCNFTLYGFYSLYLYVRLLGVTTGDDLFWIMNDWTFVLV